MRSYRVMGSALGLAVCAGAAMGFAATPGGANNGNGWVDTLNLPLQGSPVQQVFRLFKTDPQTGVSHARESRMFFRDEGDTRERNWGDGSTASPPQSMSVFFVGNLQGTLDTGGIDGHLGGPGQSLTSAQRWQISKGPDGPRLRITENVTNAGPQDRVFFTYHYFAPTLDGQATNSVSPGRDTTNFLVEGPESIMDVAAFQTGPLGGGSAEFIGSYASVDGSARASMFDGDIDDFGMDRSFEAGAPSGTVEIIFQWRLTLAPGESATVGYDVAFVPAPGLAAFIGCAGLVALRRLR